MGATKTYVFNDQSLEIAKLFKALAHPARIEIIRYLSKMDSCCCGDIVGEIPLAQATVSQHLKEMKEAGIIKGTVDGASVCYCLDKSFVDRFMVFFLQIGNEINKSSIKQDCC